MAGTEKKEVAFLEQARKDVDGLSGIDRTLVDPLLIALGNLYDMMDELYAAIREAGPMIEKEVGTVNNRHIELVENPALTTYSKTVGRAGNLAKQISTFTKNAINPDAFDDGFDNF